MRGAASEDLEILAGEEFGDVAEILGPGEVGVLHQVLVAGEGLAGAVFGQRDPAGEERPDGALVIADGIVEA